MRWEKTRGEESSNGSDMEDMEDMEGK